MHAKISKISVAEKQRGNITIDNYCRKVEKRERKIKRAKNWHSQLRTEMRKLSQSGAT